MDTVPQQVANLPGRPLWQASPPHPLPQVRESG